MAERVVHIHCGGRLRWVCVPFLLSARYGAQASLASFRLYYFLHCSSLMIQAPAPTASQSSPLCRWLPFRWSHSIVLVACFHAFGARISDPQHRLPLHRPSWLHGRRQKSIRFACLKINRHLRRGGAAYGMKLTARGSRPVVSFQRQGGVREDVAMHCERNTRNSEPCKTM